MDIILGALGIIIGLLAWLLHGAMNNRIRDARDNADEAELEKEISEGVIDVRRKAEDAKYDDPDSVKRVFEKYNKP